MKLKYICIALVLLAGAMLMTVILQSRIVTEPAAEPYSVVLRMAVSNAENHPNTMAAMKFSELVLERSDGKILIEIYPEAQLGTQESTVEQLKFGGIDFAIVESHVLSELMLDLDEKEIKYTDRVTGIERKTKTSVVTPLEDELDIWGLKALASFAPDFRCIANNSRNIYTGQAVNDLSIQLSGTYVLEDILHERGFNVVYQEDMDIHKSLRNEYIDGAEMAFLNYIYNDYLASMPFITLFASPEIPDILLASTASMGTMSVETQNIINECAKEVVVYQRELLDACHKEAAAYLRKKEVYVFPFETMNLMPEEWGRLRHKFICGELEVAE